MRCMSRATVVKSTSVPPRSFVIYTGLLLTMHDVDHWPILRNFDSQHCKHPHVFLNTFLSYWYYGTTKKKKEKKKNASTARDECYSQWKITQQQIGSNFVRLYELFMRGSSGKSLGCKADSWKFYAFRKVCLNLHAAPLISLVQGDESSTKCIF